MNKYLNFSSTLSFFEFIQEEFHNPKFDVNEYKDEILVLDSLVEKNDNELVNVIQDYPRVFDIFEQKIVELTNKEFLFEYRDSIIKKVPDQYIVLSAKFNNNNKTDNIEALTLKTKERFEDKVDRETFGYSFGSTFMNTCLPAWECVKHVKDFLEPTGGAFYSEKHSNWIVNNDNSSGENIMSLIRETQRLVKEKLDIELINEVKII